MSTESIAAQPIAGGVAPLYKARIDYNVVGRLWQIQCEEVGYTSFRMVLSMQSIAPRYVPGGEHCKRVLIVSKLY